MKKANQLLHESSPYLLQHAYNPVDWHPWNAASLKLAKQTNRMLLVSIGYSACHWCHVMEHESFENEYVARLMNQNFVCIKVDREERPDVDHLFMDAVQLLGIRGGWPLNCFALPGGMPVWGGTYFRTDQWIDVLQQMADYWQNKPGTLIEQANKIKEALQTQQKTIHHFHPSDDDPGQLHELVEKGKSGFDTVHGGFGGAPKFPMPDALMFYLASGQILEDEFLLNHVDRSLMKMASGGIYDQIGGGFARYAVDNRWHIPHFEKMLYDNAQLVKLYAEAFRYFGKDLFKTVTSESINFVLRELYGDEGLFLSALDADSEGEEGKYYVWTAVEAEEVLGEMAPVFMQWFGIGNEAVWEHDFNVLVTPIPKADLCEKHAIPPPDFDNLLAEAKQKLFLRRTQRIRPGLDDKRILGWNALMISALCRAYDVFGETTHLHLAEKAMRFIRQNMCNPSGGYFRTWKSGIAKIPAFLDDYSLIISALTDLYQSSLDESLVMHALDLAEFVNNHFGDDESGLFFLAEKEKTELAVNPLETYDHVIPSSNAVMGLALAKLGLLAGKTDYLEQSKRMLQSQKEQMLNYPGSHTHWGQLYLFLEHQPMLLISGHGAKMACRSIRKKLPSTVLTAATETKSTLAVFEGKTQGNELHYLYCDSKGCRMAVFTEEQALETIGLVVKK